MTSYGEIYVGLFLIFKLIDYLFLSVFVFLCKLSQGYCVCTVVLYIWLIGDENIENIKNKK